MNGPRHCPVLEPGLTRKRSTLFYRNSFIRLFYEAAYESKALWEVPRAEHDTAIIFERRRTARKPGYFSKHL